MSFEVCLTDAGVASLEKLMSDFSLHHRSTSANIGSSFTPKTGETSFGQIQRGQPMVCTMDKKRSYYRYRAKVKKSSAIKKEALLYFIDYGNEETSPFSRIRPLDAKFAALAGQAKEARLRCVTDRSIELSNDVTSFVKPVPRSSEYGPEAWRRFGALTEGRKLVANIDQREGNLLHLSIDRSDRSECCG